MGAGDTAAWTARLKDRLTRVEALTGAFFAPAEAAARPDLSPEAEAIVGAWTRYPALRSDRAQAIFRRIEPEILKRMERAASPEEALRQFDGFLARLPAGVQLFSLFEANPSLIDLIVDICATAPGLAAHLSRNPGVFDAVIGGSFFAAWPGAEALAESFRTTLAAVPDYEKKLDAARRWAKEFRFRVGVHHLRGLIDAAEAARFYADIAGTAVTGLWPEVVAEFARRHGSQPGRGAVVLGMGSLGAERLNAASDLDLIIIYDALGSSSRRAEALGDAAIFRPPDAGLHHRADRADARGRLYEVDMRLRPSGRGGPVAVSLDSFRDYQRTEAWTWEHLALTRARVLAGDAGLGADVEAARLAVLAEKGGDPKVMPDLAEMRARIFAAKAPDGAWEAKIGPGRLQDIELLAQSFALRAGEPARKVEAQRASVRAGVCHESRGRDAGLGLSLPVAAAGGGGF
ncbi:hypothetical protein [Rhodobacter capsulatus]|uniref:hypothetical protein n=1 Tax=Rhodobacter capsulatus TaxID=1061 RepID=UPI004026D9AF